MYAMKSDVVGEGFRLLEMTHGVCYLKQVGDACGSSVMSIIRQSVPYGNYVECAIYVVKRYTDHDWSSLLKITFSSEAREI